MAEIKDAESRIRELDKFALFVDAPGNPGKRSRLVWGIFNGNPRISVFTNVQSDQNTRYGIISAPMDPQNFLAFLMLFERVIKGQVEKIKVDCLSSPRDKDGKAGDIRKISEIFVGKNADGVIWISVVDVDEKRPKIVFEFQKSIYHQFYKADGTPFSSGECSQLIAMATCDALKEGYRSLTTQLRPVNPNAGQRNEERKPAPSKPASNFELDEISF